MPRGGYRENAGRPIESPDYYIYKHLQQTGYYVMKIVDQKPTYIGFHQTREGARKIRDAFLEANPEYAPKKRKR